MTLEKYSQPMQGLVKRVAAGEYPDYERVVVTSEFRVTNAEKGSRTNNVRYLQTRDELLYQDTQLTKYLLEMRKRLHDQIPFSESVILPVDVYVPGRRLNTVDKSNPNIKPLSVYGPIHYQPVPIIMLDWLASLSGKSPSTTGSGSLERALTKGPFNNLLLSIDLNYACLALCLGQEPVLTTAAGYVGDQLRVDHDITFIIPEIITRMTPSELNVKKMIEDGYLEKVPDVEYEGKKVPASILGYRITERFVRKYFARIFDYVDGLFPEKYLRPELQSMENYAAGVNFIYSNILKCVNEYYTDGSYEELIPPLKLLFDIVKNGGEFQGYTLDDPRFLAMFERDAILAAPWYMQRLVQAQRNEVSLLQRQIAQLREKKLPTDGLDERLAYVKSAAYVEDIKGSMGVHVFAETE